MAPILCDSTKTLAELLTDKTAGIGVLSEATSAKVTEERNGSYYIEITYPATGRLFSELTAGGIIKAKPNETDSAQLFRIAQITTPIGGQISILAYHIGYDLTHTAVLPFSATGASDAITKLKANLTGGASFSFDTDITDTSTTYKNERVQSARAVIGGTDGLLDKFNAEVKWDGLTVKILTARGADNGVQILYGKDLTDVKQQQILDSMYTEILPYYQSGDTIIKGTLFVIKEATDDNVRVYPLDVSSLIDTSSGGTPDTSTIDEACSAYVKNHPELTKPEVSIDVKFQPLWRLREYAATAPIEHVSLCDTVTVRYYKLGISQTAKVTKTVYDVLLDRYDSITLGQPKRTITDTIVSVSALADIAKTTADRAQETANSGGSGSSSGSGSGSTSGSGSLTWGTSKTVKLDTNSDSTGAAFTGTGALDLGLADKSGTSTVEAHAEPADTAKFAISGQYGNAGMTVSPAKSSVNGTLMTLYAGKKLVRNATLMLSQSGSINARANSIALGSGTSITGINIDSTDGTTDVGAVKELSLTGGNKIELNGVKATAYITIDAAHGRIDIHADSGVYVNGTKIG